MLQVLGQLVGELVVGVARPAHHDTRRDDHRRRRRRPRPSRISLRLCCDCALPEPQEAAPRRRRQPGQRRRGRHGLCARVPCPLSALHVEPPRRPDLGDQARVAQRAHPGCARVCRREALEALGRRSARQAHERPVHDVHAADVAVPARPAVHSLRARQGRRREHSPADDRELSEEIRTHDSKAPRSPARRRCRKGPRRNRADAAAAQVRRTDGLGRVLGRVGVAK
eukprot:Amastigsp_a2591_6.p3 type:complete len:226 gc:universal Amastigsp_a2591_6:699-22(-)